MRKVFLFLLILIIFTSVVDAVTITDPVDFEIYADTTYITIYSQTASFFNVSTSGHYLDIYISGTHLNFTTTTNETLTGISYLNDVLMFTVNGSGVLTTTVRMNTPSSSYAFFINNVYSTIITTNSLGDISFNYSIDDEIYNLRIEKMSISTQKTISCNSITDYKSIVIILFAVVLMIFGFGIVISSIKIQNMTMIMTGITTIIVGFALLLLGNYILSAISNVLY